MKKAWGIVLLFSILLNTVSGMAAAQTDNEREFLSFGEGFEENISSRQEGELKTKNCSAVSKDEVYNVKQSGYRFRNGSKSLCFERKTAEPLIISDVFSKLGESDNAERVELELWVAAEKMNSGETGKPVDINIAVTDEKGNVTAETSEKILTDESFNAENTGFKKLALTMEGSAVRGLETAQLKITAGDEDSFPTVVYVDDLSVKGIENTSVKQTEDEPAVIGLMRTLGINSVLTEDYDPNGAVTRADLAQVLAGIVNDKSADKNPIAFSDVYEAHFAYDAIKTVARRGIMNGSGDGKFEPDAELTYIQAVAAMVKLAGYTKFAERSGGYPLGYFSIAVRNGIASGSSYSDIDAPLTQKELAKLSEKLLKAEYLSIGAVSEDDGDYLITYQKSDSTTVLDAFWNIKQDRGILTATDVTNIDGKSTGATNISIDGETYIYSGSGIHSLTGYSIDYYYKEDKGAVSEVVYAAKSDKNTVKQMDIGDCGITGSTLTYTDENGKTQKFDIYGSVVIYNGKKIVYEENLISGIKDGNITLIDNNGDGKYDCLNITAYEYYVVSMPDTTGKTIDDKFGAPVIKLEEYEKSEITDAKNNAVAVKDIKKDDVLRVKRLYGDDKDYIEIKVYSKTASGTVESVKRGANACVKVDGIWYDISDWAKALEDGETISPLTLGSAVTLYFAENKIIAWENDAKGAYFVGFIVKGGVKEGMDKTVNLKILTENSELVVFDCASSVSINGGAKTSAESAEFKNAVFEGGKAKEQLVKYKVNNKGKITEIYTPVNYSKDASEKGKLVKLSDKAVGLFVNYQLKFVCNFFGAGTRLEDGYKQYVMANDAKAFVLPETEEYMNDEKSFRCVPLSALRAYTKEYKPALYSINGLYNVVDYMVVRKDRLEELDTMKGKVAVVKSVEHTADSEMTECLDIQTVCHGADDSIRAYIDDYPDWEKLSPGDMILYGRNTNGNVNLKESGEFLYLMDYDRKTNKYNIMGKWYDDWGMIGGEAGAWFNTPMSVYEIRDGYIFLNYLEDKGNPEPNRAYPYEKFPIYVFDTQNETLSKGSVSEAIQYVNDPAHASMIWPCIYEGNARMMVIYK